MIINRVIFYLSFVWEKILRHFEINLRSFLKKFEHLLEWSLNIAVTKWIKILISRLFNHKTLMFISILSNVRLHCKYKILNMSTNRIHCFLKIDKPWVYRRDCCSNLGKHKAIDNSVQTTGHLFQRWGFVYLMNKS